MTFKERCDIVNEELAKLIYWNKKVERAANGMLYALPLTGSSFLNFISIPNYTDDWNACGNLMSTHRINISWDAWMSSDALANAQFPSADAAARYFIVQVAIVAQRVITEQQKIDAAKVHARKAEEAMLRNSGRQH